MWLAHVVCDFLALDYGSEVKIIKVLEFSSIVTRCKNIMLSPQNIFGDSMSTRKFSHGKFDLVDRLTM